MDNRMKRKMIKIHSGNRKIRLTVRIADTDWKREKGLMFVEKLFENEGMLFIFPRKWYGGFWMKNTFIPLSIAFLDSNGKILKILDMDPCKGHHCPSYDPKIFYYYALEVNQGWYRKNRIKEGDYVVFL